MELVFSEEEEGVDLLKTLPWHKPLAHWTACDASFLQIRAGASRHIVRFITLNDRSYAIKETSGGGARREFNTYRLLRDLHIPSLQATGFVTRPERPIFSRSPFGPQYERPETGFIITRLLDYALPDSYLFTKSFSQTNRRHIWNAVVLLFVKLHTNGVYWGDASLSNMLIRFVKERFPEIGYRTVLRAFLADAETVECRTSLSAGMRRADLEYFLETMLWNEADLQARGLVRDQIMTRGDQEFIKTRYADLFEIEKEEQSFELVTRIDLDSLLGSFTRKGESKALLKHIYEHRWYVSEDAGREVRVEDAAEDWYKNILKPVIRLFEESNILDHFPESNAPSLYLDLMMHKYYLSERMGRDSGILVAFKDFARQYVHDESLTKKFKRLARLLPGILRRESR